MPFGIIRPKQPFPNLAESPLRKFFPKDRPLAILEAADGQKLNIKKFFPPKKRENPKAGTLWLRRHKISPDYAARPLKPLGRRESAELKKLIGQNPALKESLGIKLVLLDDVEFYRDSRNLFIAREFHRGPEMGELTFKRILPNGSAERNNYASFKFETEYGMKSRAMIITGAAVKGVEWSTLASPQPENTGRGFSSALRHFFEKRGITRFTVDPFSSAKKAYFRAGFRQGKASWVANKKK